LAVAVAVAIHTAATTASSAAIQPLLNVNMSLPVMWVCHGRSGRRG
jgi:hypothetical protein